MYFGELKELLNDETVKVCNLQSEVEKAMKDSTMKQLTLEELKEEINDLKVEKSIIQDANNKIVMSIMDKIIDGTQENVPAKPLVTSTGTEPMANVQPTSKSSIEIKPNDNAKLHVKNGINDNNKKTEENEIARKEKDIERRVMELEEELNKKLETEREAQMLKSQEEQKKKEYELKLKEYEMQQEMNMAEKENLKQQVDQKEALLSKCNLKVDQLKEELKTLRFQLKELECTNLKMSEKLTSKDVEIQGLQEVQKELTKKIESQLLEEIQGDNEEEEKQLSISSGDDEKHESEDLKEEISAINDEEDLKAESMHLKLAEVSEQYEKAQELLQEKEAAIDVYKLEVDKLICDLDSMKLQNESLLLDLEEKEEQNRLLSMKEESEIIYLHQLKIDVILDH
ncbi:flagellar attachment zone protein 1-like [Hetaerina americana]|uniref:flagellar attachment zone protein 1-like n=1 Tax=Hetaerina americana TaxID=62018 RepID=UPI003A7F1C3E